VACSDLDADVEAFAPSSWRSWTVICRTLQVGRCSSPTGFDSDIPEWARRWQRLLFEMGGCCPAIPGVSAVAALAVAQYAYMEELRAADATELHRRVWHHCASLLSFGTPEQQQRWAIPILRAGDTASLV